ncbi:uncharacterized protein LOC100574888 [Acyrthosiphon pisum]|uniref:Regulatory protein zeste n=1 Tax=Acyrthosiphon pisum TaxID=7029 RepID=A0A8R1W971_ACYPI|nr:uncharacterized protein LOC100574888 [Acyrthosiphon pisum]|eukprot:XP_003245340.1 PREDICTED: uncharacterized protein LOC100574888 [Acyrthosiphon pisum]
MTEKLIKRNPVFQADEINLLDSLVYKHVLENKQKGAVQLAQKSKYWNIVADEFNAAALNVSRSALNLKKCWENRKNNKKAELCAEKRNKKKTGGGPEETIPTNEAIDQFLTTITDIEVHGVVDSDSLRNMSSSTPNNFETILQDCDIVLDGDEFMRQHTEVETTLIASEEITKLINLPNQEKELNSRESPSVNNFKKISNKVNESTFDTIRLEVLKEESDLRIKRQKILIEQDAVIHKIRLEEVKQNLLLAEQKYKLFLKESNQS